MECYSLGKYLNILVFFVFWFIFVESIKIDNILRKIIYWNLVGWVFDYF